MRELGTENISGTPGTSATLTLTAASSPAFPRMNEVAPVGSPIHYTIETAAGQVVANGVGISTAAGAFTRQVEYSSWDGTTYTVAGSLASIPSGCKIYCGLSAFSAAPLAAPSWNGDANRWIEPSYNVGSSASFILTSANRDHFWRFLNRYPHKVDAVAYHAAGIATFDIGIYEVDYATGGPGKLLLGWQGVTSAAGMNTLTLAARTLGALAASPQPIPVGDLYGMMNASSTGASPGRGVPNGGAAGSIGSDMANPSNILYAGRTVNTSFGDSPTIGGRHANSFPVNPLLSFRGA